MKSVLCFSLRSAIYSLIAFFALSFSQVYALPIVLQAPARTCTDLARTYATLKKNVRLIEKSMRSELFNSQAQYVKKLSSLRSTTNRLNRFYQNFYSLCDEGNSTQVNLVNQSSATANLLRNSGFEDGLIVWKLPSSAELDTELIHSGVNSLRLNSSSSRYQEAQQDFLISSTNQMDFSVWLNYADPLPLSVSVKWFNETTSATSSGNKQFIGQTFLTIDLNNSTVDWKLYTSRLIPPRGAKQGRLLVSIPRNSTRKSLRVDDASASEDVIVPTPTLASISTPTLTPIGATPSPVATILPTLTITPTRSATRSATFTATNVILTTPTFTRTLTPTQTSTSLPQLTATFTRTMTHTATSAAPFTATFTQTRTPTQTATSIAQVTSTSTRTATPTSTMSLTATAQMTQTATRTPTLTYTRTPTRSATATAIPTSTSVGPALGINSSRFRSYSPAMPFVNVMKQADIWDLRKSDGRFVLFDPLSPTAEEERSDLFNVFLDAQGYPHSIPSDFRGDTITSVETLMLNISSADYPAGQYRLKFDGNGTIALRGDVQVTQGTATFNQTGGSGEYTFNMNGTGAGINLTISRSDASNPIRNIRILMPGYSDADLFYPPFLDSFRGFKVIRFMDWTRTNGSLIKEWRDRTPEDYAMEARTGGASFEHAIDLANAVDADPWINIPHMASDDFITRLAQMIHARMSSNHSVYVEYSNELWNGNFDQVGWVQEQACANPQNSLTFVPYTSGNDIRIIGCDDFHSGMRYQAKRSAEIFTIFHNVFGNDAARVINVIANDDTNNTTSRELLGYFTNADLNLNPNGMHVHKLAIAPYFGRTVSNQIIGDNEASTISIDTILNRLQTFVNENTPSIVANAKAVADSFNVQLISYEGGQSLVANDNNSSTNDDVLTEKFAIANRSLGMYDVYRSYLGYWFANTDGVFVHFNHCQAPNSNGMWGALEHLDQKDILDPNDPNYPVKYRALKDVIEGR